MIHCSFDESNAVLDKPANMTYEQCEALSICRATLPDGTPVVVSCCKVTDEELAEIVETRRVWVMHIGVTIPPILVTGHKKDIFP